MRDVLRLLKSAGELRPYYLGIVIASLLTAATALAIPFVIKAATDITVAIAVAASTGGSGDDDAVQRILLLAALILVIDLVNSVVANVGGYLGDVMAARLREIMSRRYFAHLLTLPQRYYDDELTGTIVNRLNRSITETTQFLQSFSKGRTTPIIAHRLSTISSVDTIVTLRDGRVDEIGTPEHLAGTGGIYAELSSLQASPSKRDRKRLAAFDITA